MPGAGGGDSGELLASGHKGPVCKMNKPGSSVPPPTALPLVNLCQEGGAHVKCSYPNRVRFLNYKEKEVSTTWGILSEVKED